MKIVNWVLDRIAERFVDIDDAIADLGGDDE